MSRAYAFKMSYRDVKELISRDFILLLNLLLFILFEFILQMKREMQDSECGCNSVQF